MSIGVKSIAMLIDELSVTNIKCFMAQEHLMNQNLSEKERLDGAIKAQTLNKRRNELMVELDKRFGEANSVSEKTY